MIKRYSDIHDENLLTVINNLQNNHDLPFDGFLKVERGNNIDGSSCWRLVLKGKQGFFFWFRADFQNPYVDANPRYDKTFGGLTGASGADKQVKGCQEHQPGHEQADGVE